MRRLAKASSAFNFGRSGSAAGRNGRALACLLGLLVFAGSSAPAAFAADPPLATTEPVAGVTATGAALQGKVNPNGAAVATCRFEYGTTTEYGAAVPCEPGSLGTGKFNVPVSASIEALEAGVTYHFRLVAASVNGAANGADGTFTTEGTPACPNADRRLEQGIAAIQLPDCMALEQVSPPRKINQRAAAPVISANGERIRFLSLAALASTPGNLQALQGDSYLADRESGGWTTSPTSPPYPVTQGWGETAYMARSFTPDLSSWVVLGSTVQEQPSGIARLFRGGVGGSFDPPSPTLIPINGSATAATVTNAQLHAASADLSRMFLVPGQATTRYLPTDPSVTGGGSDRNVYVVGLDSSGQPSVALMARDKDGKNWGGNCGARVGGVPGNSAAWRNQGAVSDDGSRSLISARAAQPEAGPCSEASKLRILLREETQTGVEISELIESECNRVADPGPPVVPACGSVPSGKVVPDGDDLYQGASVDQTKVYFITSRQLTDSDTDGFDASLEAFSGCVGFALGGCDLYLYDAEKPEGERLTQVSAGEATAEHPTVGSGAEVRGTVAISGDGSRVYFAATGVLTADPNPPGNTASEYPVSTTKLYSWDVNSEAIGFVGALAAGDAVPLWASNGTFLNAAYPVPVTGQDAFGTETGGAGTTLFFSTQSQLTPEDADGARIDAYRYDAESTPPTLQCISCRPGGPDAEPVDATLRSAGPPIAVGTAFAEFGRWASEDGETALVQTTERLSKQDLNDSRDDYIWQSGKLSLIPGTSLSGATSADQSPPVVSHDGDQVAFQAYSALLPSDRDTAPDVYVARSGGGFPFPASEQLCIGEGCRPGPMSQPGLQGATSETTVSRGNVQPQGKPKKNKARRCSKGKRKVTRKGKTRCVKVAKRKQGSAAKHRRANRNQGGQK